MSLDAIFFALVQSGGVSGMLIAMALLYLALQVRALNKAVDGVRQTIGEKVFPRLDQLTADTAEMKGRYEAWERLRDQAG